MEIMNDNQLILVKVYVFHNPDIHKIEYIFDNSIWDCHKKYFHTFEYRCVYDIELTNIGNNEIVN